MVLCDDGPCCARHNAIPDFFHIHAPEEHSSKNDRLALAQMDKVLGQLAFMWAVHEQVIN
jgi:hypothetical protein